MISGCGSTKASDIHGTRSPIDAGEILYKTRSCAGCHSVEKDKIITGPSWRDMFGSQVPLEGGATVTADEEYVRESILAPAAKIHRGFPNVMPSQQGMLREQDINAIIAYMKSISVNFKGDLAPLHVVPVKSEKALTPTTAPVTPPATRPATVPAAGALDKKSD